MSWPSPETRALLRARWATLTAVSGSGRFEGVSGVLDAMATLVVTEIPDLPSVIFLDVAFTLEGTLSFPSRPRP